MKEAREARSIGQAAFAEEYGLNVRTYRKNEGGLNEAGMCLISAFVSAGINANWLLTGEGPMLLAELDKQDRPYALAQWQQNQGQAVYKVMEPPPPFGGQCQPSVRPNINADAFAAILSGIMQAMPGAPPDRIARLAVECYMKTLDEQPDTPAG